MTYRIAEPNRELCHNVLSLGGHKNGNVTCTIKFKTKHSRQALDRLTEEVDGEQPWNNAMIFKYLEACPLPAAKNDASSASRRRIPRPDP